MGNDSTLVGYLPKLMAALCLLWIVHGSSAWAEGNSVRGKETAAHWCASCHQIAPEFPARTSAPSFMEIGLDPSKTAEYIKDWIFYPHSEMPNFRFSPEVLEDLTSYIASLRKDPASYNSLIPEAFHEDLVSRRTNAPGGTEGRHFASGAGFFITRQGHVLTVAHLLEKCDQITVEIPGLKHYMAERLRVDKSIDLALLKVDFAPDAIMPLTNGIGLETGEQVATYGFPLAGTLSNEGALSIGHVAAAFGIGNNADQFQMSAELLFGSSGGPVLDSWGRVVGIAVSRLVAKVAGSSVPQGANFAIKVMPIRIFLAASGIMPEFGHKKKELSSRQLGAMAKNHTVRVACWR